MSELSIKDFGPLGDLQGKPGKILTLKKSKKRRIVKEDTGSGMLLGNIPAGWDSGKGMVLTFKVERLTVKRTFLV